MAWNGRLTVAAILLLVTLASGADAATGSARAPVTIRGTGATAGPSENDGSTIVLRGSTPPPSPPAFYPCPPGYADVTGVGCLTPNDGNYADQSDDDWDWWPYDFGNSNAKAAARPQTV
jgi:hypothetical protein